MESCKYFNDPFKHHLGEVSTISFTLSDNLSLTCTVVVKIYNASNVGVLKASVDKANARNKCGRYTIAN